MKTVFTDLSQIAHLWANQLQDNARNSASNFYFNSDTIYSYGSHFPIAKHVVNEKGEQATLFTERKYSNTTAKHIAIVRHAANHKNIIYCHNPNSTIEQNFKSWLIECEGIAANLLKAKKPEIYLSQISYIAGKAKRYANFHSVAIPENLLIALSIGNKAEYEAYNNKRAEYEAKEKERLQKELAARHKKELAKWIKGESYRLYVRDGFDYLRLMEDQVETTQGVHIPMEVAKELWYRIKNNALKVGDSFLQYEVLEVSKNIRIGCHNLKRDYLLKFGDKVFNMEVA
jgi:hypothetical protein